MRTSAMTLRTLAVQKLGSKCARCDECDPILLDIDHVNGDGAFQRKLRGQYSILKEIALGKNLEKYQLLCVKHHRLKTRENNEHLSYMNSIDRAVENLNKSLEKKSWKARVATEKRRMSYENSIPKRLRTKKQKQQDLITSLNIPEASKKLLLSLSDDSC